MKFTKLVFEKLTCLSYLIYEWFLKNIISLKYLINMIAEEYLWLAGKWVWQDMVMDCFMQKDSLTYRDIVYKACDFMHILSKLSYLKMALRGRL